MKRLLFFDGQFLTAKDLLAEQSYHIEKRRLHNRRLHGVGVVDGLGVSVDDGAGTVAVSPGLALDSHGNEILVEDPVRVELGIYTSDVCFITIEFTETATDPVAGTSGGVEFSRITEGYAIKSTTEDPSESANTSRLWIARLIRVEGRWVVDETYCRRDL